ncbi:uncharacterized protein LOC121907931 isoform X2 [Thunnus maccoyii]|uniref:uncharacterized protein LOC121907931 isoform X2 n=1 Tax=Thunnus maccoyii TaxID=8240 RepID=UPI001C4BD1A0|nr:uncharacterized protein LOC121907931 isoform X2 [Thunnus maccoyii]
MHLSGIFVLMLCHLSGAVSTPVVIIQVQQWGVVGDQRVVEQVLLNGVPFIGTSKEVSSIIQTISLDAFLSTLTSLNQIAVLRNHTVLRSRECILEGSQLLWTDRMLYDGEVYLTLDHNDTWTAHLTQALAFKALWDQEEQHTRTERIRLQEGCIKLMRELRLSGDQSVPGFHFPRFLIPVLALLAFIGLIIISLFLYKKQGMRHPGGVIGSIIHYPANTTEPP